MTLPTEHKPHVPSLVFEYYVDADKIRVMRTPKGSTCGHDQEVVCLCATQAGGMRVAVAIAQMLNAEMDASHRFKTGEVE
jgi:hypothetical protein